LSKSSDLPDTTARHAPENLAILLRQPFRLLNQELIERLALRGHPEIRYAHGNVLQYLDDAGTRVSVLAERAQMTKQAMAQLVAHLEKHGYVERVADPGDRRAKLVRSTPRGREVFAIARAFVDEVETRLTLRLGEAKLARLRALLLELDVALRSSSRAAAT
jgi:DNA-binding MarR family transcriptional regulator